MGSRKTHKGADTVYAAAKTWVDRALRTDDSLFTSGVPIWSLRWLGELRKRFLDRPEEWRGPGFFEKLQRLLTDSPPEVYQLMGEVLYVSYLIVSKGAIGGKKKRGRIDEVLRWSTMPVAIPDDLVGGLTDGMAHPGSFFIANFPLHPGYIIELVEQWKEGEVDETLLDPGDPDAPWKFKKLVKGVDWRGSLHGNYPNSPIAQQEALLHLVHPDTFEAILSVDHKNRIAAAFAHLVTGHVEDVDCRLAEIRRSLEAELGEDFDFYQDDIYNQWVNTSTTDLPIAKVAPPSSPMQVLANDLHLPVEFLENIETLLVDKKQVIFQGPPGTGKTYVAQKLANHLAGSKDRVTLVQFHPSYAYEDFVQGFRPAKDGQPGFELRDGPLRRAAECARDEPDAKHFLIIDEINRGQVAKVLGELYFLLEYRDSEMNLQYSGEPFSLPDNLYIIGTMNTADRSIALVDLALRRRFFFVEFHPDDEPVKGVLHRWLEEKTPAMEWVAEVVGLANEKLDDRHAAIGPSYFMKDDLDEGTVRRIWKHSVLPHVEERLFGEADRLGEFDLDKLMAEVSPLDCIVDGLSRLAGISKEEADLRIEAEGGATQAGISSRWNIWHEAFKTAGLRRITLLKDGRPTMRQIAQTNPAFIARVRMHLVTVIDGEAFEACENRTDMDRTPNHYWIMDESGAEDGE